MGICHDTRCTVEEVPTVEMSKLTYNVMMLRYMWHLRNYMLPPLALDSRNLQMTSREVPRSIEDSW